jgi:hypothetical protein
VCVTSVPVAFIPSPPSNGFHVGPLFFHAYGLAYVVAVIAAVAITVRRWEAKDGERDLVYEVALFVPAGTGHHSGYQIFSTEPARIRRTGLLAARTGTASTVP